MTTTRRLTIGVQASDDKFNMGTSLPANDCCRRVTSQINECLKSPAQNSILRVILSIDFLFKNFEILNKALNPQYENIGKGFVHQYYAIVDNSVQRANVTNFYSTIDSFMTFEGLQIQGAPKIMEKLSSLTFQKITCVITAVDS
uniref:NTF2-related export protein n=1 Tax=Glossina morsitans morsitans TaxID=37546 RepID=A0A1B0G9P0_GLOMM